MAKKKKAASTKKTTKKATSTKKTTKKVAKKTSTNGRKKKAVVKSPWYDSVMNLVSRVGDVPEDVISLALSQKDKGKAKKIILNWSK